MKLYLVRHGQATSKEVDSERPLTDKGRSDVKKVAEFIKGLKIQVGSIWHSGKKRAAQTAEILASAFVSERGILQEDGLAPNSPIGLLLKKFDRIENDLVIVGHLPFLDRLASTLLLGSNSEGTISFCEGGVLCLERENKGWHVAWMLIPNLL